MERNVQEGIGILVIGAIVSFVPALLMGDALAAVQFAAAFTVLFVLPLTPWVLMLERPLFERFALATVLGIGGIPIVYFIIGVLHGPMTFLVFLGIPLLVFIVGFVVMKRKKDREVHHTVHHAHNAPEHHPPAEQPPVQPPVSP